MSIYNHPSVRQLYMHTTLWDIIYIGHIIIDFLMQWPIYWHELHKMCLCVCVCVCVWKPTTNKLFTDRVLGISSIEFRQINPVL